MPCTLPLFNGSFGAGRGPCTDSQVQLVQNTTAQHSTVQYLATTGSERRFETWPNYSTNNQRVPQIHDDNVNQMRTWVLHGATESPFASKWTGEGVRETKQLAFMSFGQTNAQESSPEHAGVCSDIMSNTFHSHRTQSQPVHSRISRFKMKQIQNECTKRKFACLWLVGRSYYVPYGRFCCLRFLVCVYARQLEINGH